MPWYYAENGQQKGPVTDDVFQSLITAGTVRGDTLVWREGMANWAPYNSVAAPAPQGTSAAPPPAGTAGVMCAECRQFFPPEQTVRFGDAFVCPNCKPVYVQKLREGATTGAETFPGAVRYAGFWIRVVAKIIDSLIIGVPMMILFFLLGMGGALAARSGQNQPGTVFAMLGMQALIQVLAIGIGAAYNIYFIAKRAATPGKMAVGLKVINADGSPITVGKATGRYFAEMVSGLTCYIGYIIAGFDEQKRTLHDHICSTRVIYK